MTKLIQHIPVEEDESAAVVNPKGLTKDSDAVTNFPSGSDNKTAISASAAVMAGPGVFLGLVINSFTVGAVITVYDNATAASGNILGTYTLSASNYSGQEIGPVDMGITCANGAYYNITVAAANITPLTRLD